MRALKWAVLAGVAAVVVLGGLAGAGATLRTRAEAEQVEGAGAGGAGAAKEKPRAGARLGTEEAQAAEAAIRKVNEAYAKALQKGDLEAVMATWSSDCEFASLTGKVYRGKEAVRALFKKGVEGNKGVKQAIKVRTLRLLKPDVAVQEGVMLTTGPDGDVEPNRFSVIWVKQDGKWLIASARDLYDNEDTADRPAAYNPLQQLSWLVGEWQQEGVKDGVKVTTRWAPGQTFLIQNVLSKGGGEGEVNVTQWIGWDPAQETIRSWIFDNLGGFASAVWTREGNTWVLDSEGTVADGRALTAVYRWKYVSDDKVTWTARDRQADEQPLQDLDLTLVRSNKAKAGE